MPDKYFISYLLCDTHLRWLLILMTLRWPDLTLSWKWYPLIEMSS